MAATAPATAAPAPVVLLGEDEVALGRVIEVAGLKRLGNGSRHEGIKVTVDFVESMVRRSSSSQVETTSMEKRPFFAMLLFANALALQPLPATAQAIAPQVITAATAPQGVRPALAREETALADPVREALRTLPQAKKRFLAGLPQGDQFLLSVRVVATDTSFRQASARVLGWHGTTVQALLLLSAADSSRPTEPLPVSFPEAAVLDWTLVRASGREEGNYVGRYTETARQLEGMRLR